MNTINNIGPTPVQRPLSTAAASNTAPAAPATPQAPAADRVELSGLNGMLETLRRNDIRTEKVAGIRAQIEAGTYEDDYKLEIAADRLLDDLSR
jgi:anti-sigma28 factor (negative regulator of flagellin synthesis)